MKSLACIWRSRCRYSVTESPPEIGNVSLESLCVACVFPEVAFRSQVRLPIRKSPVPPAFRDGSHSLVWLFASPHRKIRGVRSSDQCFHCEGLYVKLWNRI